MYDNVCDPGSLFVLQNGRLHSFKTMSIMRYITVHESISVIE